MSRVSPLLSLPSKLLLAAALVLATGACSGSESQPSLLEKLFVAPSETLVWNNVMPGTRPRCNAQLRLLLVNRFESAITLHTPEAVIAGAEGAQPLRRFTPLMTVGERLVRELKLAPGDSVEVQFRSPDFGLEPIDIDRYPKARVMLRMASSFDLPLQFGSPVTDIFVTQ